jgi:hypothetical protein
MPTKLIQIKVDHIAGVDRPANRRKFLIVKSENGGGSMETFIPVRPMSDSEAKTEIEKRYGNFENYRKAQFKDPPLPEPQPIVKSKQELLLDEVDADARRLDMTRERYLQTHPAVYERVRQAGY